MGFSVGVRRSASKPRRRIDRRSGGGILFVVESLRSQLLSSLSSLAYDGMDVCRLQCVPSDTEARN